MVYFSKTFNKLGVTCDSRLSINTCKHVKKLRWQVFVYAVKVTQPSRSSYQCLFEGSEILKVVNQVKTMYKNELQDYFISC